VNCGVLWRTKRMGEVSFRVPSSPAPIPTPLRSFWQ
jgi:hypothetical protein